MAQSTRELDRQTYSVVVIGDFNPSIFHPLWFSANELMPLAETQSAEVSVIHKQLALFSMGNMQVQVDDSRFSLTTVESPNGPTLRDLAIGTLSVLEHTPLKAIGLNLDTEFVLKTDKDWHAVGNRIVPKVDWAQIIDNPGMRLAVVEGKRPECEAVRIHIRVQPSGPRSVLVAINQHYQLETQDRVDVRDRHTEAIRILQDDWNSFSAFARDAALKVIDPEPEEIIGNQK